MKNKILLCFLFCILALPSDANAMDLRDAVFKGDLEAVRQRIEQGNDVNKQDVFGDTPLHLAVHNDCFRPVYCEIAKLLISAKANVNAKEPFGRTPLHYAMERGSIETTKLLLQARADVNAQIFSSQPARCLWLTFRVLSGTQYVQRARETCISLQTPLYYAIDRQYRPSPGEIDCILKKCSLLIFAGANPDLRDYHGFAPRDEPAIAGFVREFEEHMKHVKKCRQEMLEFIKTQYRPSHISTLPQSLLKHIYDYVKDSSKVENPWIAPICDKDEQLMWPFISLNGQSRRVFSAAFCWE